METKRINISAIADMAFYIALAMEIAIVILENSAYIIEYDGRLFRITFVLFLIKLILTKYSIKEWMIIGAFALLGLISYLVTGHNEILRIVVMVAACKNLKHDAMLKFIFYATLAGCLILAALSFFGIGTLSITTDFGRGVTTRYCFGMGHPNALHCMFWALCTLYLYVYRDGIRWFHLIIIAALNAALFIWTDSRAGVAAVFFTVMVTAILNTKWSHERKKYMMLLLGAELFTAFASAAVFMSHSIFWNKLGKLDELVTGRLLWTHMLITDSKTFFWSPFSTYGRYYQTDLGIVKMIYWYGYIPAIIFMVMCFVLAKTAFDKKDTATYMMVASIIMYSVFEGHDISVYLGRNYIFFLWGKYWIDMFDARSDTDFFIWELQKCTENNVTDG